jgi:hypothetical protein
VQAVFSIREQKNFMSHLSEIAEPAQIAQFAMPLIRSRVGAIRFPDFDRTARPTALVVSRGRVCKYET